MKQLSLSSLLRRMTRQVRCVVGLLFLAFVLALVLSYGVEAQSTAPNGPLENVVDLPSTRLPPSCTGEMVAERMIVRLGISSTSQIDVSENVPPGSRIVEDTTSSDDPPATLDVPAGPGEYFVLFIDDEPLMKWEHAVRFAWYDCVSDTSAVRPAVNKITIYPPYALPTPYSVDWATMLYGVMVTVGHGDFAGETTDTSHKPEDDGSEAMPEGSEGGDDRPPASTSVRVPQLIKRAYVLDGGDKKGWREIASSLAADAEIMANYVRRNGFDLVRRSQYWGNTHTYIPLGDALDSIVRFIDRSDAMIREENSHSGPESYRRHELFIYIASHGGKRGTFSSYSSDGTGTSESVRYADVIRALLALPRNVTIYMFVDACYSGTLITLGDPKRLTNAGMHGVYLLTASDATNSAANGHTFLVDSATEDFRDGIKSDLDKDDKSPDDIGDGYSEMVDDSSRNPQRWRRPDRNDYWYFSLELKEPEQVEREPIVP